MSRYLIASVVVLVISSIWYVSSSSDPPAVDVHSHQSVLVGNTERHFTLVVPRDLPSQPSMPFAFHGTGDTPTSMAAYSQLNCLAAQHRFILVYPAASGSSWDTRCNPGDSINADEEFIDQLLEDLAERYNPDSSRVYAVGMSNGATFSLLLAGTRSTNLAAVVAHSGIPPYFAAPPKQRSPVMLIVGEIDPAFDSISTYASRENVPCVTVPGLAHEWSSVHNDDLWQFLSKHTSSSR